MSYTVGGDPPCAGGKMAGDYPKESSTLINHLNVFREAFADSNCLEIAMIGILKKPKVVLPEPASSQEFHSIRQQSGILNGQALQCDGLAAHDCKIALPDDQFLLLSYTNGTGRSLTFRLHWDITGKLADGRFAEIQSGSGWQSSPLQALVFRDGESAPAGLLRVLIETEEGETLQFMLESGPAK